jgi:asparagine synthase (glutamine-hydrolysing)
MCGISGWIDWREDLRTQADIIEKMSGTLAHRGPDAQNIWLSPCAALGHCRLVVVDPEGGGQPMSRNRGENRYIISYNGELYNTLELRQDLEARGYTFLTRNSDTEALLLAYMEWGPACLERWNLCLCYLG